MPLYLSIHVRKIVKTTRSPHIRCTALKEKPPYQIKEYKGLFICLHAIQDKVWLPEIKLCTYSMHTECEIISDKKLF